MSHLTNIQNTDCKVIIEMGNTFNLIGQFTLITGLHRINTVAKRVECNTIDVMFDMNCTGLPICIAEKRDSRLVILNGDHRPGLIGYEWPSDNDGLYHYVYNFNAVLIDF